MNKSGLLLNLTAILFTCSLLFSERNKAMLATLGVISLPLIFVAIYIGLVKSAKIRPLR